MTKNNSEYNNDINILHLVQTIWAGKFVITTFILLSCLIAFGIILTREITYSSTINIEINNVPPVLQNNNKHILQFDRTYRDFKSMFYNRVNFKTWKKSNVNSKLSYEKFSNTKTRNGILLSKGKGESLVEFKKDSENNFQLIIYSNKLSVLNDFYNYSTFINDILKIDYIVKAKNEINIIEGVLDRFKNKEIIAGGLIENERFIALTLMDKKTDILDINRPNSPKETVTKSNFILAISLVLGIFLGVVFVICQNFFRSQKVK